MLLVKKSFTWYPGSEWKPLSCTCVPQPACPPNVLELEAAMWKSCLGRCQVQMAIGFILNQYLLGLSLHV